jgi:HTH-type transcriptional regulator, sugar sensing transcriptional regulator
MAASDVMITSSKVMDALKGIGLNLYERRLWVAILARGTSTAGELSEIANVPRSRSYDILQSLADKGYVLVQTGKPIRYVAVSPNEAFDRAKKKYEADLKEYQQRIDDLKESPVVKELTDLFQKGMKIITPEEMTGSLKGKYSVSQQITSMLKDASKNINIVTNEQGLNDIMANHMDILRDAKSRGVNIKIATNVAGKAPDNLRALSNIAEVRSISKKDLSIEGKFFIVDGEEMLLPLTDPNVVHDTQDLAIWSKSSYVATNLLNPMFDHVWTHGKKV